MTLREATAEKHKEAENHPFNQRMIKGKISEEAYALYLTQLYEILTVIENNIDLPEDLKRTPCIDSDLSLLENITDKTYTILDETWEYSNYINRLSQEEALPHVYLNYMAILFGGQMMKKNVPGKGEMYNFKNSSELISYIRSIQKDEWSDEVNKGFDYIINIFNALEKKCTKSI